MCAEEHLQTLKQMGNSGRRTLLSANNKKLRLQFAHQMLPGLMSVKVSAFGINNMEIWIYLALYQQLRLLLVE